MRDRGAHIAVSAFCAIELQAPDLHSVKIDCRIVSSNVKEL